MDVEPETPTELPAQWKLKPFPWRQWFAACSTQSRIFTIRADEKSFVIQAPCVRSMMLVHGSRKPKIEKSNQSIMTVWFDLSSITSTTTNTPTVLKTYRFETIKNIIPHMDNAHTIFEFDKDTLSVERKSYYEDKTVSVFEFKPDIDRHWETTQPNESQIQIHTCLLKQLLSVLCTSGSVRPEYVHIKFHRTGELEFTSLSVSNSYASVRCTPHENYTVVQNITQDVVECKLLTYCLYQLNHIITKHDDFVTLSVSENGLSGLFHMKNHVKVSFNAPALKNGVEVYFN